MHVKNFMLSAICFNLDQSKILSSGYGLRVLYDSDHFNDDAKAIAIPWVFSKNSRAKKGHNCVQEIVDGYFFF